MVHEGMISQLSEPDPAQIVPFEAANTMVFIGGPTFDPNVPSAVFGMITGVRSHAAGVDQGIEIRRVLLRAPRMQDQLEEFVANARRGSLTPVGEEFGVGWAFRDKVGWGLAYYFESCELVRSYEDMSGVLPVVEDVLVVRYARKVNITDQLQSRIITPK